MYSSNSLTRKVWLSILQLPMPASDLFHTDLENKRIYIAQQLANDLTPADTKTVQHRLGHSTASLTMDIYTHTIAQDDREAANTIGHTVFSRSDIKSVDEEL